jgi:hypothetical protein
MADSVKLSTFAPGSVVAIHYYVLIHVGIASDCYDENGFPYIISNTRRMGGVTEEPQLAFANDREPYLVSEPQEGSAAILARARELLGRPYDVATYNCEHFVTEVMGDGSKSPQLRVVGAVGGLAAAVLIGVGRWRG